jgi:hypothetical protein
MAELGDFRLHPSILVTPADGLTGVSIDLLSVTFRASLQEYIHFSGEDQWLGGAFTEVTIFHGATINRTPSISMGSPTIEMGLPPTGMFRLTSVFNQDLANGTLYTWSFTSIDVTHNSFALGVHSGVPQRNTFNASDSVFTTIALPGSPKVINPFPSNTGSNIKLSPILTWEAG